MCSCFEQFEDLRNYSSFKHVSNSNCPSFESGAFDSPFAMVWRYWMKPEFPPWSHTPGTTGSLLEQLLQPARYSSNRVQQYIHRVLVCSQCKILMAPVDPTTTKSPKSFASSPYQTKSIKYGQPASQPSRKFSRKIIARFVGSGEEKRSHCEPLSSGSQVCVYFIFFGESPFAKFHFRTDFFGGSFIRKSVKHDI